MNVCPRLGLLVAYGFSLAGAAFSAPSLSLLLDADATRPVKFAAEEIRREAVARGIRILVAGEAPVSDSVRISLGTGEGMVAQGYAIRVKGGDVKRTIEVRGADAAGVMYGGLEVAEAIRTGTLDSLVDSDHQPHIARRGIKMNIPLDLRTPSYTDPSDAAQANIPEVWSMDFWRETFDDMARHRYNVISLWNLHPFPSMVKVPEFPSVALDDVWRTMMKLDDDFDHNGHNYVKPEMLANHEVVKRITIDGKIDFWRDVMQLAKERGVDVYLFTWNIFLHGAEGKDGITRDKMAPRTIEYFRASVRETIRTYPLLAGIGITAGEGFAHGMESKTKEDWLWRTYGEGIRDALKVDPQRKFQLIHRFHQTGMGEIQSAFAELPCQFDLSFKYAMAHMYSIPKPPFITEVLPQLSPAIRSWLTIRNDDIYSFRWADVDYVRAFIKGIPGPEKIAGFYMGPDGYFWGRDFLTKDVASPRPTVMKKQWLSFALWGRLAYDPDLPSSIFERLIAARFSGADAPALVAAWADASKTFPYITRFFWGHNDISWFPEACRKKGAFYSVKDFAEGITMPGAGVINIMAWRKAVIANQEVAGITPLAIAATLEANATKALDVLPALRMAKVTPPTSAVEYAATLGDIEAMAHLGLYYSAKIRGACDLALFDASRDGAQQTASLKHLEVALRHWIDYSNAYTRQYVQPVLYNRAGRVNLPEDIENARKDMQMAKDWKAGTLVDPREKRSAIRAISKERNE